MTLLRALIILLGLLGLWAAVVWLTDAPAYILPGPGRTLIALVDRAPELLHHATITVSEILLGLLLGCLLGCASAIAIAWFRPARRWLLPVLVISQAIPVFALAPILVLWLGYGMASKVAMATLIIFFPVTTAFTDGLRRTEPSWLDLARTLNATKARTFWYIRIPAALPGLTSGIRVATAVAPIGAIVGEWVGSSGGLGYLMLHANARLQIDVMFAALLVLAVFAVLLYKTVDRLLLLALPWVADDTKGAD